LIVIIIVMGFLVLWNPFGFFISKKYHSWIHSHKKVYCYQTYWGPINPVLYVDNKDNIDSLIQYYQKIEKGIDNPTFNFPPLSLPFDTCAYLLGYERDSMIAEVVCYYNWGKKGNYVKGFVYAKTLHSLPPNNSLIKMKTIEK